MDRTKVEIYLEEDKNVHAYICLTKEQLNLLNWLYNQGWLDGIGYKTYDKEPWFEII